MRPLLEGMAFACLARRANAWHNRDRNRNRYRDRFRHHCAADIHTEASDHALFPIAIANAIAIPMTTIIPWCC